MIIGAQKNSHNLNMKVWRDVVVMMVLVVLVMMVVMVGSGTFMLVFRPPRAKE